jgi:signal transduction histidine kinase
VNSFITWLKKPSNSYFWVTTQLLLLSVCFFSVLYWVDTEPTYGSDYEFFEFEQTVSYSSEPPVDSKDWHPVKLPQRLSESFVDKKFPAEESWTSLWYRKQFKGVDLKDFGQQNNRTWAIYIIEPYANVAIYLNDSFIGESGPMRPPIPSFRRPVMFQFPKELIKSGDNTIYYRVAVGSRNPWPNHLSIGPSHLFEEKYANRILLKKTIPFAILVMMAALTLFMLLIFYLRPQEKVYGWYALATFVWMIHHGMKLIDNIPIENKMLWHAVSYWTLGLFVAFGLQYIALFSNLVAKKINRAIILYAIFGGVVLCFLASIFPNLLHLFGQYIWVPSILLVGIYAVSTLVIAFKREPNIENKHLLLAISLLTIVGVRDYLFDFTDLVSGTTFYIQFAAGFVIIYWALILIRRFAIALDTAEVLNLELEDRVAEKSQQLKSFYDNEAESNKEKARLDERHRIMRDMHDGLGGQLVQLLALVDKTPALEPVRNNLEMILTDLRLIIDSLSIDDGDLSYVLAAFRYRTEPLLKKVGLSYDWQVNDLPEIDSLGPTAVLQILRILQESISNIAKHANASRITVYADTKESHQHESMVVVEIRDNGNGMSSNQNGELSNNQFGHGLTNMEYRAHSIGAQLKINNSPQGVSVLLSMPIK